MSQFDYKQFSERHRPHIQPPGATLFVTYRLDGSIPVAMVREYKAKRDWLEKQVKQLGKNAFAISSDCPAHVMQNRDPTNLDESEPLLARAEKFQREWFLKFEDILHRAAVGPRWMEDARVADKVAQSLRDLDGDAYTLEAYSVMSNHVHSVFKPFLCEENLNEVTGEDGHPLFISDYPSLAKIMQLVKGRSARECNLLLGRTGKFWEHESFDHVIRAGKFEATLRYVLNNPVKVGLVKEWRDWPWNYCRPELSDKL